VVSLNLAHPVYTITVLYLLVLLKKLLVLLVLLVLYYLHGGPKSIIFHKVVQQRS